MADPNISDIRTIIPAKDFELSRDFYCGLGFRLAWCDDNLALLESGNQRPYVQRYYLEAGSVPINRHKLNRLRAVARLRGMRSARLPMQHFQPGPSLSAAAEMAKI